MITVSSLTKFHAFALAEQFDRQHVLQTFHTGFAGQVHPFISKYVRRKDIEEIDSRSIKCYLPVAFGAKLCAHPNFWLRIFDASVAKSMSVDDAKVFVGWSGSSLSSIKEAKRNGKLTILERGSSHILNQRSILKEEYSLHGKDFMMDETTILRELLEYEESDYISVPSTFVYNSFTSFGIPESKLILNPYGASQYFTPSKRKDFKFRILYLGPLIIRKGLPYLFQALNKLNIGQEHYEVWFIGGISDDIKPFIEKTKMSNWFFLGHKPQNELAALISQCDVKVHPSVEEGLSMVIPQVLSCGVPVIATTNTGGGMYIQEQQNGFIIPIRNVDSIVERITYLYENISELRRMQRNAAMTESISWDEYGSRYLKNIESKLTF